MMPPTPLTGNTRVFKKEFEFPGFLKIKNWSISTFARDTRRAVRGKISHPTTIPPAQQGVSPFSVAEFPNDFEIQA